MGKLPQKMDASGNFLYLGNPDAIERPHICRFSAESSYSSDFPMLKFGINVNEEP